MSKNWIKWERKGKMVDNDEGFYYAHCNKCNKRTEHGVIEGCCEC